VSAFQGLFCVCGRETLLLAAAAQRLLERLHEYGAVADKRRRVVRKVTKCGSGLVWPVILDESNVVAPG
jgi:hypothetical protein